MDAFSISYSSAAQKQQSRIYQDYKSTRSHHVVEVSQIPPSPAGNVAEGLEKPRVWPFNRQPHIGIVGAGLAGLRCADILLRHGFHVTILEGRNRLGGRLHQEKLPSGQLVDMGPNWFHGTDDNPLLDMAKKIGTVVGSWDTGTCIFDENGNFLPKEKATEYSTLMWDIIEEAFKHSNDHSISIDSSESLLDFFKLKVVEHIPESEAGFESKRRMILNMSELWGAFVGSHIRKQSLKFFWLEECIEGENLFCASTYQEILQEVARPAVEGASIIYKTVVSKIRGKENGHETVKLLTDSDHAFEFDEVVLTTPLGWLKQNLGAFEPPLPARLEEAIKSIGFGALEKVYLSFPTAFWLKPDPDSHVVDGFCQWLTPTYATDTNPARWTQEMVDLASLPAPTGHPTLLFYTSDDESRHITDTLASLSGSPEKQQDFIYKLFTPYISLLPGFDAQSPDCQPTGYLATSWLKDDLAGNGSYSNFQVGLDHGDDDIRAMREGVPERGLWIAGEHTAPFVALATAPGAYWSGETVAKRIAKVYARRKTSDESSSSYLQTSN